MHIDSALQTWLFKATPLAGTPALVSLDASGITGTIQRALASAGLDTRTGPMRGVTDTIRQALSNTRPVAADARRMFMGRAAREIVTPEDHVDEKSISAAPTADDPLPGTFTSHLFANSAGTRTYKLYVPANYSTEVGRPVPMVVMLHGCTQSPDDFAAGTRMNALAEQHGFLVIYPAQAPSANGSKCWNWFRPQHQTRERGEPSIIAGITREVAANYRVDERRIFVAGLSAGAAMAVILGATYPELYAAVGAHSGLPLGAAHDVPSAFGAMHGGGTLADRPRPPEAQRRPRQQAKAAVSTIVFHGDNDRTVDVRNGAAIVEQAMAPRTDEPRLQTSMKRDAAPGGRTYSRVVYTDEAGQPYAENWTLHGAGHAWSGGSPKGSFTDPLGPDASAEMIRFFYSQQRASTG